MLRIGHSARLAFGFLAVISPGLGVAGTLLQFDFNGPVGWESTPVAGAGTIDEAGGREGSGGLRLIVGGEGAPIGLRSGPLAVRTAEPNLGKLTLSFDASVAPLRPVIVRVESFDAIRRRTGGLEAVVYPAAKDFYHRHALELSGMHPAGAGTFNPRDPFVGFTFELEQSGGPAATSAGELRIDNVHYATPAWYVSARGDDRLDGRSERTALATPQRAVEAAIPGDIIVLMEGVYPPGRSAVTFRRGGTPAGWITLKNYPGHRPELQNEAWNCIVIGGGWKASPSTLPAIGWVEIRGLHIRGNADVADKKYPASLGRSDPLTNGNGITVEGRYEAHAPHHVRIADNLVEYNSGGGIGSMEGDHVTIENNIVRNNCWWMIYAGSGISIIGASNFDAIEGGYKHLVRNNVTHGNRCYMKWVALDRYSDGNGIILDVNSCTDDRPDGRFLGRTLVQGNLSYGNGGSGIHAYRADRVDIVNNTAWMNSVTPELQYGQIFAGDCDDVRIADNILVAPVADVAAGEKPEPVNSDWNCSHVVYQFNLYSGGNVPPVMGRGDRVADPLFRRPSADPAVADFHLQDMSPARRSGLRQPFSPLVDPEGHRLAPVDPPDLGAFQH